MDRKRLSIPPMHWIGSASLVLAACTTVKPLEYPPDHPASPTAPAATATPTANALMTYKSFAGGIELRGSAGPNAEESVAPPAEQPSQGSAHEDRH